MSKKPVISPEYAALNKQLHAERPDYGGRGHVGADEIVRFCRQDGFRSVLDYGCGKGSLRPAIHEMAPDVAVYEFDPAIDGKDTLPSGNIDLVVAIDVMEHVESEFLNNVLEAFCSFAPKAVFLTISTASAQKTLPDGRNAHILIRGRGWWLKRLSKYFSEVHARASAGYFIYVGKPLP